MIGEKIEEFLPDSENSKPKLNPFKYDFSVDSPYQKFKLVFGSIFLIVPRILGILICLFFGYVLAFAGTFGLTEKELDEAPLSGWRAKLRWPLYFVGRMLIRCYGFLNVKVIGELASLDEARMLVVAPHTTFFDAIVIWWCKDANPSFVSRAENGKIPIFGRSIDYVQPVRVHRENQQSRQSTIQNIIERVKSNLPWKHLLVFPEGTCTNRSCLITFKKGAFVPGIPVQPIVIRYPNRLNCYPWTWDGPGAFRIIWVILCQFLNYCELEFLPVYYPNEEEKKDPLLYARNVREVMAKKLDLPTADFTYDDCKIMQALKKKRLPTPIGLIEFQVLRSKYGFTLEHVKDEILDSFAQLCDEEGQITPQIFQEKLGAVENNPNIEQLYNEFDTKNAGCFSFREYVIGSCESYKTTNSEQNVRETFHELLDPERDHHVIESTFLEVFQDRLNVPPLKGTAIFNEMDSSNKGFLEFEDYEKFTKRRPEYNALLYLSREMCS